MARIRITEADEIVHVLLTRPDKKNAMDDEMIDALIEAGGEISLSQARAVILSGEGDCFCAGIDLSAMTKIAGKNPEHLLLPRTHGNGTTNRWQEVAMVWHRMEVPVIAALHGAVYGAGLQLALGADFRIAGPDAQLAVMEMKWGLVPDMGGMVLLPRLVRADVMKRLIYTAEPVSAEQAERWGLVTEIAADPLARAQALAESLRSKGPKALAAAKALCDFAVGAATEDVLLAEARAQATLLGKPEQMEVIAAQFAKRAPVFK
jgi:enoyl-CoA hydratase/carnithine racemase